MDNNITPQATEAEEAARIPMAPVTSNQVAAVGHCPVTNTLAVKFTRGAGAIYHYPNVTEETHAKFVAAESIGKFFGQHIKPLAFKKFAAPKAHQ
jgi:hypothetical protein